MPLSKVHVVPREVPPEMERRMAVAIAVVTLAFTLIGSRLWYLQVQRGPEMR